MANLIQTAVDTVKRAFSAGQDPEIQEAEEFYKAACEEQKAFHSRWYRNIAFLMGQQWLEWTSNQAWFRIPPAPHWRVRLVLNLVKPKVRAEAARILRNDPTFTCVPGNDDDASISGARTGNRLLEGIYYDDDFQRKLHDMAMWISAVTSSFMWSIWDGRAGKSWTDAKIGPDGQPVMNPETQQPELQQYFLGDVCHSVTGPFDTFLEPGAPEDFNEHRRIMRVKVRSLEYIKERYGVDVPAEDLSAETLFQKKITGLGQLTPSSGIKLDAKKKGEAMIKEFFELESSKYPEGRILVYANGTRLGETLPCDYFRGDKRSLPVAKFDHIKIPGCVWSQSLIDDVAPLQELFNKMSSQVVENANLFGRPKVLSPDGALAENVFTDEPGEVVEYTPIAGMRPEPFKPPEMPQYFFAMKDSLPGMIDRVSGVHDVSEGRLPRRATSGKAIGLLQDADDTSIGSTVKNMQSALERLMSITLDTYGRKMPEERLIQRLGRNRQLDVMRFKGQDLNGCKVVRVTIAPALSRADKIDIAMKLAESELIPADIALRVMELGDLNAIYDKDQSQIQYAEFENMGMAKGIAYPVGPLEKHQAHLKAHEDFLNGPVGVQLPPEIKAQIVAHIEQHKQLDFLAQQQLGLAAAGAGLPANPGASTNPQGSQGA